MEFKDIFKDEVVVLEETELYKQKDATAFDKETKHIHHIVYIPQAFREAFKEILEDDIKYPTAAPKIAAIKTKDPAWNRHLDRILKG